ncbi:unnamed protein product [Owenia fusiformis]|uniref:Uncharacterized protein n=1 Tax=Owenia fusiformis TaxID=6347 RepID=A0A8J1XTU3_OWEFU|nr:unnamed protein product [Owenia fusiformis]
MSATLVNPEVKIRVSSVLNKDVKQFGKQHMFDLEDETCWNSDADQSGKPQWVMLEFPKPVQIQEIKIRFQGGFVSQNCCLLGNIAEKKMEKIFEFSPEDNSLLQTFPLSHHVPVTIIRLLFSHSTDFYGRFTVYLLDFIGDVCS